MTDIKTVIKGLEICIDCHPDCEAVECPYFDDGTDHYNCRKLKEDALKLLKEQEQRIKELESMNVTASGGAVAIGSVYGGLNIQRQTAKEIYNIKNVKELNL